MFFLRSAAFLIASILTVALQYYKVNITSLLQVIVIVVVMLIFLIKKIFSNKISTITASYQLLTLFLATFFIQLLILTTGGFSSTFMVLLHLFVLGISFLLSVGLSIVFLSLTVVVLFSGFLNPILLEEFQKDPATVILYMISFVVIVPLSIVITRTYHIKDNLSRILKEYIQISEKREASILGSLDEMVIVTDQQLRVVSANDFAEKQLKLPSEAILSQPFFDVIKLQNSQGEILNSESLSINTIIADRGARIINGLFLPIYGKAKPIMVEVQVKPIFDPQGEVSQLVFVITDADNKVGGLNQHTDLKQAHIRYQSLAQEIKKTLSDAKMDPLKTKVEFFEKDEEDLLTALELEDHAIVEHEIFTDVAKIAKKAVDSRLSLAGGLGVELVFYLPDGEYSEEVYINMKENSLSSESVLSDFSVPIDAKWFFILMQKIIDIALLLSPVPGKVQVIASRQENTQITLAVVVYGVRLLEEEKDKLFLQYYPDLASKMNLQKGSGLEGFIAKTIISKLEIPMDIKIFTQPPSVSFQIVLDKTPRT